MSQMREDDVRPSTTVAELIVRLWPHFMRRKTLFFTTLVAVFAVAAAGRAAVSLFGIAIDDGLVKDRRDVVVAAAVAYFLLELGRCFMTFLHSYLFAKVGNSILFDIRDQLVGHVQSLPVPFFEKNPTGRIVTRLTSDVVSFGEVFTQGLIAIFAGFVALGAIVVAMLLISVKMTLLTLAAAPPLIYAVIVINRRMMEVLRESKKRLAAVNSFVAENISGMRVLILYGRLARNLRRFEELSGAYREQQLKTVKMYALLWPTVSFFNASSVATALLVGGMLSLEGSVSTGALVAFVLHVRAFIDPLTSILEKYHILQNSISGAERVFTLLEEPIETSLGSPLSREHGRLQGWVDIKNVGFRYGPDLPKALDSVSLSVTPGESIALVGKTGSGKSTLIALLQRFYDPTEGEILVDGKPVFSYARRELRSRIGVVQQDAFMFRGTIAENVGMCDPSITRERIERAASMAGLGELLARSGGLEAKVEERGANLSHGEKQLIAFARILAFDPDILILDEATANIDSKTERLIQEATARARAVRTSFIIAHRISTIMDCDRIVVMDHGKIVEIGAHAALMEKPDGVYRALCLAQFREAGSVASAEAGA